MSYPRKRLELVFIRDKLEQALALAIAGEHIVADEIRESIKQCNRDIQEINDEEKENIERNNQADGCQINIDRALADSGLSVLRLAKA